MRVDDQTKVTNAIAAAIEYIGRGSVSSLALMVKPALLSELRGAIAIVSVAAKRELETMTTSDLERFARHALDTLRLRRWKEFEYAHRSGVEPFVVIARELTNPPFEQPRLPTGTHEVEAKPTGCQHCGVEREHATAPIGDVVQVEPVATTWPGGNLVVRVMLQRCVDERAESLQWTPLTLCQQCFEYVLSEAAEHVVMYGDEARRRAEESRLNP